MNALRNHALFVATFLVLFSCNKGPEEMAISPSNYRIPKEGGSCQIELPFVAYEVAVIDEQGVKEIVVIDGECKNFEWLTIDLSSSFLEDQVLEIRASPNLLGMHRDMKLSILFLDSYGFITVFQE